MTEWKGVQGRISLFQMPSALFPSPIEIFEKVWDVTPDNFKKQQNPLSPSVADGSLNGLTVRCLTQPGRLDITITPPTGEATEMIIALIEDTSKFHSEFVRIIKALPRIGISGPVTRIAIVARFGNLSKNEVDANKILINTIPEEYRVRITDETDFILQFNRRFKSRSVSRVMMNVVKKWSVERIQLMALNVQGGASLGPEGNTITTEYMANVMLEINNVPVAEQSLETLEQSSLLEEGLMEISKYQKSAGLGIKGF
jgi:hypothetical protein